jgi:putative aminopeptidase FrvX
MDHSFLLDMLAVPSPSGFESVGQRLWARRVSEFASRIGNDAYGNTWAYIDGTDHAGPRMMVEAHADEIGFMVSHISDEGFVYFTKIGGSDRAIARGRPISILTGNGQIAGVIGNTAVHLRDTKEDKVPEWHELFIDVGAGSRSEVEALGIRVGLPAVYDVTTLRIGDHCIAGRAIDNRVGGYVIARVLENLAGGPAGEATVIGVNAVQEEIGGNGARMVTYRLEPSVAIVIDVTHATDSPGIPNEKHGKVLLGGGPSVSHGTANHPLVVQRLMDVAAKEDIPIQHEASSRATGTDTDDVFVSKRGIPSALVSVPLRYMHSPVEMVDLRDVEHTIRLVEAFARSLTSADVFEHVYVPDL